MRRNPGFTAIAIASLGLAIGATTAIFSLIDTLMLRRLPVRDPQQLVELVSRYPGEPDNNGFWPRVYEHFRDNNHVFSDLIAVSPARFRVSGDGSDAQTIDGEYVTGNFFRALGVGAVIGRVIEPVDDRAGGEAAVAVISWSYWNERFGLDPAVIEKRLTLDGATATIIGVAPPEFFGVEIGSGPAVWVPTAMEPMIDHPSRQANGQFMLGLIARLRADVTIDRARSEMSVLDRWRIDEIMRVRGANSDPLWRQAKPIVPERLIALLAGLFGSLGAALAALGLYGLMAYTVARRVHEIGVRMALGSTRGAVVIMVLKAALTIVGAGVIVGLPLAVWSRRVASAMMEHLAVGSVWPAVMAAVLMIGVALLAAYVPARRASRIDPAVVLRDS